MRNPVIKQLIEARIAQKITKTDMAAMLKISRSTYDRIEQGYADYANIELMAHYLGFKLILLPKHYLDQ